MTAQIIPLRKVAKPRARRRPYRKHWRRRRYELYRAFGRRLQYVRHQLGISEQEAAAAFGVRVKTYRRYEAGPGAGAAHSLYKVCGIEARGQPNTSSLLARGPKTLSVAGLRQWKRGRDRGCKRD
jgi:ribosome-binding protein aMBF1 (putative translation factor)